MSHRPVWLGPALAIAIVATMLAAGPRQALACSCAGVSPDEMYVRDLLARSDSVLVGTVQNWQGQAPDALGYTTVAVVEVTRVYGGSAGDLITVYTGDSSGGCGYEGALRLGGEHLLSLTRDDANQLHASYCTSFPLADIVVPDAEYEQRLLGFLDILGRIAPPYGPTPQPHGFGDDVALDDDPPRWLLPSLLGLGAVSMVALTGWALRSAAEHRR